MPQITSALRRRGHRHVRATADSFRRGASPRLAAWPPCAQKIVARADQRAMVGPIARHPHRRVFSTRRLASRPAPSVMTAFRAFPCRGALRAPARARRHCKTASAVRTSASHRRVVTAPGRAAPSILTAPDAASRRHMRENGECVSAGAARSRMRASSGLLLYVAMTRARRAAGDLRHARREQDSRRLLVSARRERADAALRLRTGR